ncbi:MAG: amidohydrolase family protein [Syntrophales bacterium]|nr:amidohydrolase family protein [Syntrophales bacterium]
MVIDVHVHICPPEVRNERERFLDGEAEFAALYKGPQSRLAGAGEVVAMMDREGVDKAVVFGFPWDHEEFLRFNNDYVLQAAARFQGRLIPFVCVKADHPGASSEVERCLGSGARGVGELAFYTNGLDEAAVEALKPLTDICHEAQCPILLHTNEPVGHHYPGKSPMTLAQLYRLLKIYDKTTWILAHLGGGLPFYCYMKKEVREVVSRCWFDTAALPYLYRPQVLKVFADAIGAEKLLFGSDFPLILFSRYKNEFLQAGLNQEELEMILGKNAQSLLSI